MNSAQVRDGGQGASNALSRGMTARMTEAGRTFGHPVTARAARTRSRLPMQELLRPATVAGDIWRLGQHIIVCGDATDPASVAVALDGYVPRLMVTDPPYGVSYDPAWRERARRAGLLGKYGASALGTVLNDDRDDWQAAWRHFTGDVAYVWHGALHGSVVRDGLEATGLMIRSQIVWDKGRLIISRGHYHWQHECAWYAVRKGRTANWVGDRKQVTIWKVVHRRSETGHATQKPVEIMKRPMLNHTIPGERVYDPFLGSGTTIIAAEEAGRICHGIEINPVYIDLAVRRWEAASGCQAKRIVHG